MVFRARRIHIVVLLVVACLGAVTAYENEITPAGYLPEAGTDCYPCHVTWDPPMREIARLSPPTELAADAGEVFEFPLRLQNAWIADLIRFEPSLDLANAPSLGFVGEREPELGERIAGAVEAAGAGGTATRTSFEVTTIEAGTTDLRILLEPANQDPNIGPDLTLNIYPVATEPSGSAAISVNNAGSGGTESYQVTGGSAISEVGFGSWVLEVEVPTISTAIGSLGEVPYTLVVDRWFNTTGETVRFLSKETTVKAEQTTIFTWPLVVLGEPGPSESVKVAVNLTSYYVHDNSGDPDFGYFHKEIEVPVSATPTGVEFGAQSGPLVPDNAIVSQGVSMSRISELVGYASAFLVAASIYTGGMFGKATRRHQNKVFGTAKRRVAFHNFLSYGLILAAIVHTFIFLWPGIEGNYHWTLGLIWGSLSILAMLGLGVTGALQVPMIRHWNYSLWRWTHFGLSIATIVFTIVHILLDGGNFADLQGDLGWEDPLDFRDV